MKNLRKDFPILKEKINGYPLIYLDNASTSQKPQHVIDAIVDFYSKYNANVFRGTHAFGEHATHMFENTRSKVAQFIDAQDTSEVIFVKGSTAGINFIASTWAEQYIDEGDEIVITELEHHANLLPWQRVADRKKAKLKAIRVLPDGLLDMGMVPELINEKTKLVAVSQISNSLGTHIDVLPIIKQARSVGAKILIDAAQSAPHEKISVQKLDCDFLVFSGQKMLGPTGIGILYIKKYLHDLIEPYQLGGGMVFDATLHTATWLPAPQKFEAGSPPIAQVIGLGAAIDYLNQHVDFNELKKYEALLCSQAIDGLSKIDRVRILGPIAQIKKMGHMVSFIVEGIHGHDVAAYLSNRGICVRAGHHCAQPLALAMSIDASIRASFYLYNTPEEVDMLIQAVQDLVKEL